MSIFLRRAQRIVEKLEARLVWARAEVERQIQLDVKREAEKAKKEAERAEKAKERKAQRAARKAEWDAKKPERDAAKKAATKAFYEAHPGQMRLESFHLLMSICLEKGLKCDASTADAYMAWKSAQEFPPNTNRYQKCMRFINERILPTDEPSTGITIYAKTMTGELIPLVYHPHRDARDLLTQLELISPQEFPIGSTSISRLCEEEEANTPVKEGDIFGLFQHGATLVSYKPQYASEDVFLSYDNERIMIQYYVFVKSDGFVQDPPQENMIDQRLTLYYFPEDKTIATQWDTTRKPLAEAKDLLRHFTVYQQMIGESFALTDQAQEEIMSVFDAIRRDK